MTNKTTQKKQSNKVAKPVQKTGKATAVSKTISKSTRNGQILQTRDNFLGDGSYKKSKHNNRSVVVVDTNRNNEKAVIKLTTEFREVTLPDGTKHYVRKNNIKHIDGKSFYKNHIETTDNENKPIVESNKFIPRTSRSLTEKQANEMKKSAVNDLRYGKENRAKLRKLKGR